QLHDPASRLEIEIVEDVAGFVARQALQKDDGCDVLWQAGALRLAATREPADQAQGQCVPHRRSLQFGASTSKRRAKRQTYVISASYFAGAGRACGLEPPVVQ